ncbi:hypothetical protein SAMN05421812_110112 [Asanoa hainanensis]|uniref:Uncharacterized protein n=1 Tax=Asanoa hainanensis TaxID=560556 RepID=A0A239NQX1_9ACTN|nr:hypothetical protein [Asanoa hainanensis]SNT57277.1 hypothetical protein SAMN05421812_110112 [Asanoa hainanensis]
MTHRPVAFAGLLLAVALTTACGAEGGTAMPTPSAASSSDAPTRSVAPRDGGGTVSPPVPPPVPPKVGPSTPSDYIEGGRIGGRVVKGGSGPCYAVVNDDNQRFALHSAAGLTLEEGSYITAEVGPLRAKIDCGEGIPYELISFKRL